MSSSYTTGDKECIGEVYRKEIRANCHESVNKIGDSVNKDSRFFLSILFIYSG